MFLINIMIILIILIAFFSTILGIFILAIRLDVFKREGSKDSMSWEQFKKQIKELFNEER